MPQYQLVAKISLVLIAGMAFIWKGIATPVYAQDNSLPENAADVRLLIDVSGSMKGNDPANLRQPAIDLLVKLLPEGSKAGVWSFGKYVNMMVPHKEVGDAWKVDASSKAGDINSTGLFTNIGLALEKASYDAEQAPKGYDRHLILLTDGMVDIAKDPAINEREWQRIANELLPKLKQAGFSIHTIALSDKADTDLLQQLSRSTDGHSAIAHSADELMQAFLQAFDKAAPAEQLPFDGESFLVDSSVEEFTALIFSAQPQQEVSLIAPDGSRYSAQRLDETASWFAGDSYDLVTIKHPFEGEWQVDANVADNSRITVVSDLSLKVKPLPNNISPGEVVDLTLSLRQEGETITDATFLSLLDINAQLSMQGDGRKQSSYKLYSAGAETPEMGVFQREINDFDRQGQYLLRVEVDGKSFQRSFTHRFNIQAAFQAKLTEGENEEGQQGYILTVSGADQSLNLEATSVAVNLVEQDGNQRSFTMELGSRNNWELYLPVMADGLYQFEMVVSGEYASGEHLRYNLPPLSLVLDGDSMSISDKPMIQPAEEDLADEESEAETEPVMEEDSPNWLLYGLLAAGNLLVIGLLYFAYRVFVAEKPEPEDEEDEDDFIDVNAVVDDSDIPIEEAIAEVKEAVTPKGEESQESPAEPSQEGVVEADDSGADQSSVEPQPSDDVMPLDNEMGNPEDASIGDDVLAMDDLDEGSGPEPADEAPQESEAVAKSLGPQDATSSEDATSSDGATDTTPDEVAADTDAGEPPVLNEAVELPDEELAGEELPEDGQAEAEGSVAESQDNQNENLDASDPGEPEPAPEPNIEDEIDALLEQSNQADEEDDDWAAALQSELDDQDGIESSPADEAAADLSASLDLADEAVADADLAELGTKKNAEEG